MKIKYTKLGVEFDGKLITLEEINEKCNSAKILEDNLALLTIQWDERGGSVTEQIVKPLDKINRLKDLLLNKEVSFGEIWGKHSEVYGNISEKDMEITTDKKEIKNFLIENPNGRDYDHSFIDNYIDETEDQMDEEDFIESGHKRDIEEIIELLK